MFQLFYKNTFALLLLFSFYFNASAQLELKLQLVSDLKWGVYAKPAAGINPSSSTITGSGQATVIMPAGYQWADLVPINGFWVNNVTVVSPMESPDLQYVSFGLQSAEPSFPIPYVQGQETLLFTFEGVGNCPEFLYLLDCGTPNQSDPFCPTNSVNSNPGNDLSVIDFGSSSPKFYNFTDNYAPSSWSCLDNDGDGFANAHEDTNGNGEFDALDASDMNDALSLPEEDGIHLKLQLVGENQWGVFAKPVGINPTESTITGSGQATVVMPSGIVWHSLESVNGFWISNAAVDAPIENEDAFYVHFGLLTSEPSFPIKYKESEETLLFTFKIDDPCPHFMHLIDCGTPYESDPFCKPNSVNSNPGNDMSVIDFGHDPPEYYNFSNNYAPAAWDCQDDDNDGYGNGQEDTNGNGIFDEGDVSDLNNPNYIPEPDGLIMKLALVEENKWGVYVKANNIPVGEETTTASGQATLVMPKNYAWSNLTSVHGFWVSNATVNGPSENPEASYVSIGLQAAGPSFPIPYINNEETLLFTFEGDGFCPDFLYLIDCGAPVSTDPFCPSPANSLNTNPGNDLSVIDQTPTPPAFYYYEGNYATLAWDCNDCDNDGLANGLEDINGTGAFEPGEDASHFCDTCEMNPLCRPYFTHIPFQNDIHICAGNDTYIIACANYTLGEFHFSWERSEDGGMTWDVVDFGSEPNLSHSSNGNATANGCDTLFVENAAGQTDMLYRAAAVSNGNEDVVSESVKIVVEGPFQVAVHPLDMEACMGGQAVFSAEIINTGSPIVDIGYQWQFSQDNIDFFDVSNPFHAGDNTTELKILDVSGLDEIYYRLAIKTPACENQYTNSAQLQVLGGAVIADQPDDVTTCFGSSFEMQASISILDPSSSIEYQWQYSPDGINFAPIIDSFGGIFNGFDTNKLSVSNSENIAGICFRMSASVDGCEPIYTDLACLNLEGPFQIFGQPEDQLVCVGNGAMFSVEAETVTQDPNELEYQWETSTDGGITWQVLTNGLSPNGGDGVNGSQSDTMIVMETDDKDGQLFRAKVFTDYCDPIISETAVLRINEINIDEHPIDVIGCEDGVALFVAGVDAPNDPAGITTHWQWQIQLLNSMEWEDLINGYTFNVVNIFAGATSDTLLITPLTGLHGARVRLTAWMAGCETVISDPALISVEQLEVTGHPVDVAVCAGGQAVFNAQVMDINGTGNATRRWEYSTDGIVYIPVINDSNFSGATSSQLAVADVTGLDGMYVRLSANTNNCERIFTETAQLHIADHLEITQHPTDVTTCAGDSFEMTANASFPNGNSGSVNYQWQVSSDGLNYSDIQSLPNGFFSGYDSHTLSCSNSNGLYGLCYRVACSSMGCATIYSDPACLKLQGPFEIIDQSDDVAVCAGINADALFALEIQNHSWDFTTENYIEYQWEESADGGATWQSLTNGLTSQGGDDVNGVNSDTLSIMNVNFRHGHLFRVNVFSDQCQVITSDPAVLTIEELSIIGHPSDIHACESSTSMLSVFTNLIPADPSQTTVFYQWEESTDGGISYSNLQDGLTANGGSGVTGSNTPDLEVLELTDRVGHLIRAKTWTAVCGDVLYSEQAEILPPLGGSLTFALQPLSVQNCEDGEGIFLIDVESPNDPSGTMTNYQWQILLPNASDWEDLANGEINSTNAVVGANSETLFIAPLTGLNGALVRAVAWVDGCETIVSQEVEIRVEGVLEIAEEPMGVTLCAGMPVCFSAEFINPTGVGNIQYQWEYTISGVLWADVTNTGVFGGILTGATTEQLCISNTDGLYNYKFRLKARTSSCEWVFSSVAQLTIEGPINFEVHPMDSSVCIGESHLFNATVNTPLQSAAQPNIQWQHSPNNGLSWTDLSEVEPTPDGGQYFDVQTENLLISQVDGLDGSQYHLRAYTSECEAFSDPATLTMDDDPNCELDVPKVTLGLKLLPNRRTWAVVMKPKTGYLPSDENLLTGGEVTIAVTQGFNYKNLFSKAGGDWETSSILTNLPDQSGLSYFTFTVEPSTNSIDLKEEGTVLFTFTKDKVCPDTIFIMDGNVPVGLHPNYISGIDTGNSPQEAFYLGGYHEIYSTNCIKVGTGETPDDDPDSGFTSTNGGLFMDINTDNGLGKNGIPSFHCYPNPADQQVTIQLVTNDLELWENITVRLMSIQGQTIRTLKMTDTNKAEVDISALVAGMYFLQMEKNGAELHREKLVKR